MEVKPFADIDFAQRECFAEMDIYAGYIRYGFEHQYRFMYQHLSEHK